MSELSRLAILTTGRQDYGVLRSTIALLRQRGRPQASVWVGGMHCRDRFGRSERLISADGVPAAERLDFLHEPPDPAADAAAALAAVAGAIERLSPDALLLVGDRAETLAAGFAATVAGVPIVHLHGGEETEGAIDNAFRHALTKLAHLHLVSHQRHARRVEQMGEDPASVVVVGAPGLDHLYRDDLPAPAEVARQLGLTLADPLVIVTMHPTTLGGDPVAEVTAVAQAMLAVPATYIVTAPNADQGGAAIRDFWLAWTRGRPKITYVEALSEARYWSLLRATAAVLGNSSSFIIEAPAAGVPVVNVGIRQRGRLRYGRVADVPALVGAIAEALREAVSAPREAPGNGHGYPAGPAAPRILTALESWKVPRPPRKAFRDLDR